MIPAPFRFFEVKKEELPADAAQFDEAELGVAPEAFDPVDMVFAAGKLVFVVMNAPVFVSAQEQAIVAQPAIGVNGCLGKHLSLDDRLQLCPGAVFHHASKDFASTFEKTDDGRFAARSTTTPAPNPSRTKVGFVDLDFSGKGPGFLHGQIHDPHPQELINPLAGLAIDHRQFARAQRRYVRAKHL